MGIFSSKTKTTVGTSIQRVIEDSYVPDSILEGFTSDLFNGGGQMLEYMKDNMANSIALRVNRMYSFGKKSYVWGLPSGTVYSSYAAKQATKAAIESTQGPVQINYYHFGPLNSIHRAWKELTEIYGYKYATNIILGIQKTAPTGFTAGPTYLKDMRLVVTDATLEEAANGSLDQWGTAPNAGYTPSKLLPTEVGTLRGATPFVIDPSASQDYVLVTYEWEVTDNTGLTKPTISTETFKIFITGYDLTKDYHMAEWTATNGSKKGYFIYRYGSGNTALDTVFNAQYNDQGNFLPWVYFRYKKQRDDINKESIEYKHAKKMAKYMNMDYQDLVDSIHENPDINDVEQALMVMGVPADTENSVEQKYLFDFFSGIYQQTKDYSNSSNTTDNFEVINKLNYEVNQSSIIIQDKRFKMALQWRNIIKRRVAGSIGDIGTFKSGAGTVPSDIKVPSLGGSTVTWDTSVKSHWYQKQVTTGVYEEVLVYGLKMVYYIIDGYTTTGDENNEELLLIPIDVSIARAYSLVDREELYTRSLHFIFNSVIVTKLKWYQAGIFRFLMLVVAIVITVYSYGSTWQTIGAALAAGTITISAVVMSFLQEIVKLLVFQLVIKLFVQAVDWKIAIVVAMVVAASYAADLLKGTSLNNIFNSKDLITLSNGLIKESNRKVNSDLSDVLDEISEFQRESEEALETLKSKTEELLNENNRLSPLIIFGETPSEFYDRTIHYGNIGTLSLDIVSNYVEAALRLPQISDTLKGV